MTVSPTLSTRWRLVASFPLPCTPRWLLVFFEADCSNAAKIVKSFAKLCKNELGVRYFKRLSIHCLVAPLRPAPYNQEAYDAECAALARALEEASRRNMIPDRVTIFSDAQAAIRRMASDEPGPGQKYAIQARRHIAELRKKRPGIAIEIRWCPAHKGVEGNEKADEWAKLAAEEPDTRGVEWLHYLDRTEARPMPLPRSLANIRREIYGKKWAEARKWAGGRSSKQKYSLPDTHKPDATVPGSTKRLASRFYQLKAGHCRTGQYLHWTKSRPDPQCWWCQCPSQTR